MVFWKVSHHFWSSTQVRTVFIFAYNQSNTFLKIILSTKDLLKSAVAAAISAIVFNNFANQTIALKNGIIRPLGLLLKSRNMTVQLKVSAALEALAVNNQAAQEAILEYDAANFMIRLMEVNTKHFIFFLIT